jgi:hypothetical protein
LKKKRENTRDYKKEKFRKKIIMGTSLLVLLSIPFVFIYFLTPERGIYNQHLRIDLPRLPAETGKFF